MSSRSVTVAAVVLAIAAIAGFGQARLQFEVASIRPSATPQGFNVNVGIHVDGAQVRFTLFNLVTYVAIRHTAVSGARTGLDGARNLRYFR